MIAFEVVTPLFLSACLLLAIAPGPDLLIIVSQSLTNGWKFGIFCSIGIFFAGVIQTLVVSIGLGTIMQTIPIAFKIVRIIGAAYLAWLGLSYIKDWFKTSASSTEKGSSASKSTLANMFFVGLINNLLNPKALLFFGLFLPQFVQPADTSNNSQTLQLFTLGITLSCVAFIVNSVVSFTFNFLKRRSNISSNFERHLTGLIGVLFIYLSINLVFA